MLVQEEDGVLDANEVAKMLRINERTVKRLATQHKLPGFRVGGQWRFRREAIDNYIRRQEQQPNEENQ